MDREHSSFDACKILNLEYTKLREWMRHGFVKAYIPAEGQGTKAVFQTKDLVAIKVFSLLLERGVSRAQAANLAGTVTHEKMEDVAYLCFWFDDKLHEWRLLPLAIHELNTLCDWLRSSRNWQPALVIDLQKVKDEVMRSIGA